MSDLTTDNFRLAAKAFIVKDNKLLLIKRRSNDVHKPSEWDIPGGRLELGENPFIGLKRETKEETNLDIDILLPIDVHHFVRDDKQKITMIIFLCKPINDNVDLSEEHTEYTWKNVNEPLYTFPKWIADVLSNYLNYKLDKIEL